jgi:hypothetical protein
MGGVVLGTVLRNALPNNHLAEDSRDAIRLGAGLVSTIAALVLGLLIASAKSSYDTQADRVQHLTANVVLLDNVLARYGPEARPARATLRQAVGLLTDRIWQENSSRSVSDSPIEVSSAGDEAYAKILTLSPKTDVQSLLKTRAVEIAVDLAQTRLLLFERVDKSIPVPFLIVLIFWLAIIFASYSLFSGLNPSLIVMLFVFALSASAAIYLILELSQPFAGLMHISSTPLRNALTPLGST